MAKVNNKEKDKAEEIDFSSKKEINYDGFLVNIEDKNTKNVLTKVLNKEKPRLDTKELNQIFIHANEIAKIENNFSFFHNLEVWFTKTINLVTWFEGER